MIASASSTERTGYVSGTLRPNSLVHSINLSFSCSLPVISTLNCTHVHPVSLSTTSIASPSSIADATPEQLIQRSTFSFRIIVRRESM